MKHWRKIFLKILHILVIMIGTLFMSVLVYNRIMKMETEEWWEQLSNLAQGISEKIHIRINDNMSLLERTADSIILHDALNDMEVVAEYLRDMRDSTDTLFDRVDVVFKGNTILMDDGVYHGLSYRFPFESRLWSRFKYCCV